MTETDLESHGLSLRSRPKVAGFMPILKSVDSSGTKAAHIDVDMATGENWLVREPLVAICKQIMTEKLNAQDFSYPHGMGGTIPLLSAFASFFNQYFNPSFPIAPEHLSTGAGASTCLDALLYAICDEGDSILLPSPFWGGYECFTKLRADVNIVATANLPFRSAVSSDILAAVKDVYSSVPDPKRIKALLMNNPNNPIGRCYSASTMRELMVFCKEKGLHYISDEVFAMSTFVAEGESRFTSALALVNDGKESPMSPSRVHVIYSMSKDFGLAGIRMACLISPRNRPVLEGSMLANYLQTSILNSLCTTGILTFPALPSILTSLKSQLASNYALLTGTLDKWGIEYIPAHAGFHIFAKLAKNAGTWEEEAAIVKQLADAGVMVSAGKGYGGVDGQVGWLRVAFSMTEEKLREGLGRIERSLGLGEDGEDK